MTNNELFWLLLQDVGLPMLFGLYTYATGMSRSIVQALAITLFFAGGFHLWRGVYNDYYWYGSLTCLGLGVVLGVGEMLFRKPVPVPVEVSREGQK